MEEGGEARRLLLDVVVHAVLYIDMLALAMDPLKLPMIVWSCDHVGCVAILHAETAINVLKAWSIPQRQCQNRA